MVIVLYRAWYTWYYTLYTWSVYSLEKKHINMASICNYTIKVYVKDIVAWYSSEPIGAILSMLYM